MKLWCLPLAGLILAAAPAAGQRLGYHDVLVVEGGPRLTYAILSAADLESPGTILGFYGDRFEYRPQRGRDAFGWDVSGEIGSEAHRLWMASVGDGLAGEGLDYLEVQALYSHPITESGLAVQAGVRRDFLPRPRRSYAVLGVQGNVTEPLYVGAFGFLSDEGEFTARLFAYYDLALGRGLVLQPATEIEVAGADVPELGIGSGPVYVEAGLRLRYRLAEAFAPYVGVHWERLLGRTARFAREAGDEVDSANVVLGVRSYF